MIRLMRRTLGALVALCWLVSPLAGAQTQTSIQDLFRNAKFASARLSPNGKYLATTTNINGRFQLAVVEVATGAANNVAGFDTLDVTNVSWINDDRLAYSIIDRDGEQRSSYSGLFAINRDGSKSEILMQAPEHIRGRMPPGVWMSEPRFMEIISDALHDDRNSVMAVGYFPNRDAVLYRVDTLSGKRREVDVDVKGIARRYGLDHKQQLRVVVTTNTDYSVEVIWYRDAPGQAWRKLSEHSAFEPRFSVAGFDNDGKTMYVTALTPEGLDGIYKYDFAANKPGELVVSDKTVDVSGGLVYAPDTREVMGVRVSTEPPKTIWFSKPLAVLQQGIDKAMPGTVNVLIPSAAGVPLMIYSYSSTQPGQYTLYHPDKKKLQNLFVSRPWIDPKKLSTQLAYDYKARDGLPILSYLTLPLGRDPRALPLVVLVHGGPWGVRDSWGFDPQVQFLAGLGYAVLQPQYRGSGGFGDAHFKKSFTQWGLAMQDDVSDGVHSLVKQGVVDAQRVCIMGASYGGYAAMQGLVKDPDQYRCGVNLFGVTNLFYISSADSWGDKARNYSMNKMLGDPSSLKEQFNATSPAKNADKIKAAVFMAYGEKDYRVPLVHGEDMRDGLKKHGKVFEYMELEKEEHGIANEETRYRVFTAIEKFLLKYNPPR